MGRHEELRAKWVLSLLEQVPASLLSLDPAAAAGSLLGPSPTSLAVSLRVRGCPARPQLPSHRSAQGEVVSVNRLEC